MPLPAALLARLAKRGIIEASEPPKTTNTNKSKSGSDEVEEVFAEDYDDPSKPEVPEEKVPPPVAPQPPVIPQTQMRDEEPIFRETTACPFRSNPYHTCVPYCKKTYGMREWKPESKMIQRRERMLTKYPLPEGWVEVGDHDTSRYYYWNLHTDEVSWLSPTHPKAEISQSAEQLDLIGKIGNLDSDGEEAMETIEPENDAASEKSGSDTSLSDEEEYENGSSKIESSKIESRLFKTPPVAPAQSKPQEMKKSRGKAEELDPMDPASYSDVARGGWSDGLDMRGKAKTGVDETASGPLFQQRPYPSPGDILRANQTLKKKK